jgi:predicted DCC family thiol-disulfide oxidoreductase YuxK
MPLQKTPDTGIGRARAGRLAVLYDGACAMCRASAEMLREFDNSNQLDLMDFHDEDLRAHFPDIKLERLMDELHVVDDQGRVRRGARAVNEILRHQNGVRGMLAWLWYLPGFAWLADWQYRRIAQSRYDSEPARPRVPHQTEENRE